MVVEILKLLWLDIHDDAQVIEPVLFPHVCVRHL